MIPNKHHGRKAREYHAKECSKGILTLVGHMENIKRRIEYLESQFGITDMMRGSGANYSNTP